MLNKKENIRIQQAKKKWVKEGDANTSFLHGAVERRGRMNGIKGLRIDGRWLEEVEEVKSGILRYFENHFKEKENGSFRMHGLEGERLNVNEKAEIESLSDEEEIDVHLSI